MSYRSARNALEIQLEKLGYPAELADVLARELKGEKSINRMTGYLKNAKHITLEDIADEMLAIQQDASTWRQKKIMESNQAKYNLLMQNGLKGEEE